MVSEDSGAPMMMEFGRDINQLGVSPKEMRMEPEIQNQSGSKGQLIN